MRVEITWSEISWSVGRFLLTLQSMCNNIAYKCGYQDGEIATLKKELETLINIKA